MILKEKEINYHKLKRLIGEPIKSDLKSLKVIGTTSFFLKTFKNKKDSNDSLKIDSKNNFELFENGLLLRSNLSNKISAIPIPVNDLLRIKLIRGKEMINPFPLSPMWILLKLGVSILYARYFQIYKFNEYRIEEMKLIIETIDYGMEMIENSYKFESQQRFFENLNYKDKITIDLNKASC
ncbi:hypothetical protein [Lutibacter oricola]|nr:hypothetical protein [Lutibacter oricola]